MSNMFWTRAVEMSYRLIAADSADSPRLNLRGEAVAAHWKPAHLALVTSQDGKPRTPVDVPWFSDRTLVVTQATRKTLGALVEPHGELLDIVIGDEPAWLFHPTKTIDALDLKRSKVELDEGHIVDVEHYEFVDVPEGDAVFTLGHKQFDTLYTEPLKEKLEALNLSGLRFEALP